MFGPEEAPRRRHIQLTRSVLGILVSVSRPLCCTEMTPVVGALFVVHTPQGYRGTDFSEFLLIQMLWRRHSQY